MNSVTKKTTVRTFRPSKQLDDLITMTEEATGMSFTAIANEALAAYLPDIVRKHVNERGRKLSELRKSLSSSEYADMAEQIVKAAPHLTVTVDPEPTPRHAKAH